MEEVQYRAFISYSHRDTRWADWLHKSLESYRPPKQLVGTTTPRGVVPKRLAPVFRDREELASATDLGTAISEALRKSICQIVICSPQSAKSRWVNEEILAFKRLGREDRIFCLIIDGEPNASDMPGREDEECFPPAMRYLLGADGNLSAVRSEPIAADARPGKDGKNRAKLKLIAGLLGVGFDSLRRREQQRRNRQLFILTCGATAGMVVTSGLATYALIERSAAEKQTVRAEAEAETAKQTTKFMVDLFRISDPGEARGNTVTAREMLDKGAARIDTELANQPSIQATLMDTVGTVYMGLGLYDQARPMLDRAVDKRRHMGDEDPIALSDTLTHLGDLLTLQAQYEQGEKAYRDAISALSAQPPTAQNRVDLARSMHGLGDLLYHQGRYPESEQTLRKALELQRAALGPVHADIALTLQDLSMVIDDSGNTNAAIPVMKESLDMQRKICGDQPHPALAQAINDYGALMSESGNYDAAEKYYLEAIAMKTRVYGDKHPEVTITLMNLARIREIKGDLESAEATLRQVLGTQREMLGEVHPDVGKTLHNLAMVQYQRGDRPGAMATERQALQTYRRVFSGDNPEIARAENRLGFWLLGAKQYAEAQHDLEDALAMRRRLLGEWHEDTGSSLYNLALLQVALGKNDEALATARSSEEVLARAVPPGNWKNGAGECAEGAALMGLGRYPESELLLQKSIEILASDRETPPDYREIAQRYLNELHVRERHAAQSRSGASVVATAAAGAAVGAAAGAAQP